MKSNFTGQEYEIRSLTPHDRPSDETQSYKRSLPVSNR